MSPAGEYLIFIHPYKDRKLWGNIHQEFLKEITVVI